MGGPLKIRGLRTSALGHFRSGENAFVHTVTSVHDPSKQNGTANRNKLPLTRFVPTRPVTHDFAPKGLKTEPRVLTLGSIQLMFRLAP